MNTNYLFNVREWSGKQIEQPKNIKWVNVRPYSERERNPKTGSYLYTRSDTPIN